MLLLQGCTRRRVHAACLAGLSPEVSLGLAGLQTKRAVRGYTPSLSGLPPVRAPSTRLHTYAGGAMCATAHPCAAASPVPLDSLTHTRPHSPVPARHDSYPTAPQRWPTPH